MLKDTHVRKESWVFIRYNYKNDEFSAEILQGQKPTPCSPIGIGWIIIGGCNLKCIHCYGNIEQLPNIVLSTTDCLFIADKIIEANIMRVTISGGEPMLRDDIFCIIQKFYDNNISIILGTNGTFIQKENVCNLQMCTRVEISLDANTHDLNNRIRPSSGPRQMHPFMNIKYSNRTSPKFNKFYCLILPDGQIGTEDINLGRKIYFGSIFTEPILSVWNNQNYNLKRHFEKWINDRISYIPKK